MLSKCHMAFKEFKISKKKFDFFRNFQEFLFGLFVYDSTYHALFLVDTVEEIALDCGRLTRSQFYLWINVQYWSEGVLFSFVGAVGLIGNLCSIAILMSK
jgi:hypothetical protein